MPATRAFIVTLLAFVLTAVAACGGDHEGGADAGSPTAGASPTRTAGATLSPGGNDKTPIADESPGDGPAGSPAGGTPRPTAPSGTLAVAPDDQAGFLAGFTDKTIDCADCRFDPATSATDCGEHGEYRVDPVLKGQDVSCRVGLVDDAPALINCTSQDPAQAIYYEITE
jgi:hypothetical protein